MMIVTQERGVMTPSDLIDWSARQAYKFLPPLGNRWKHVQAVVEQAFMVGEHLEEIERAYLIASAYMHDIGYSPIVKDSGFHPLDGAWFIKIHIGDERLASLVAYHTGAQFEADQRRLGGELAMSFPRERSAVADALTYCDLTSGPAGQRWTIEERLADIYKRHAANPIITTSIRQAEDELRDAYDNILALIGKH